MLDPADFPRVRDRFPAFELQRVEIGADAFARLPEVLRALAPDAGAVLVLQDPQPMRRGAGDLKPWLCGQLEAAGMAVEVVELTPGPDGVVHADFAQLERVRHRLRPGVPVVALGSGTVTDVAKHACFRHGEEAGAPLPLVFCPTALSVLAYTARMAVIAKDGVKRTWPSRLSDALLFDLETLRAAPQRMTLAGFGDLAPVHTSFADWRLAELLGLATVSQASYEILADVRANLANAAPEVRKGTAAGLAALAKMNVLGGLSATVADESSPLSGYEHVTGHMLDMGASHFGRGLALHGAQVGAALVPHAIAFRILLDELDPDGVDVDRCIRTLPPCGSGSATRSVPSTRPAPWRTNAGRTTRRSSRRGPRRVAPSSACWPRGRTGGPTSTASSSGPRSSSGCSAAGGLPLRFDALDPPIPEDEGRWAFYQRLADAQALQRRRLLPPAWLARRRADRPGLRPA